MAAINLKALRESLTPDNIKEILEKYDIEPKYENNLYIQYPTCCHNINGGSYKLYYYKNTHLFRCYTDCNDSFDIVELILKINKLRGKEISINEAVQQIGFDTPEYDNTYSENKEYIEIMKRSNSQLWPQDVDYKDLGTQVLNKYIYNEQYLFPWIEEGISRDMLREFEIKYDPVETAIVIPHRDINGKLIGVRGRFMAEDAIAKYMPLKFGEHYMAHSLSGNLYGIYQNQNIIRRQKTVVLFESEKSVLKFGSYFGADNNFSLATCGNKISNEQIKLLLSLGITHVVLAFDKDYHNEKDMAHIQENYEKIGKRLANYFSTSIIMDYGTLLDFKDSPIDKGKVVFEELYRYRYYM